MMIRYQKYYFKNKDFKGVTEHVANVGFQKDIEQIKAMMQPEKMNQRSSAGELLTHFFEFYTDRFRPREHVVSIADSTQYLSKAKYRERIERELRGEENDALRKELLSKLHAWAFVIADPFDITYNPGKTVHLPRQEDES